MISNTGWHKAQHGLEGVGETDLFHIIDVARKGTRSKSKNLFHRFAPSSVDVQYGSVSDPDALASACEGVDSVIHLVAIIQQRKGATFDSVNRQGAANVVAAAEEAGSVKELVQVSAIGASSNRSYPYLHSKWEGEQEVIKGGLPYTIIRSSLMFGEGDEFTNSLAALVRVFPLVPVIGTGRNRLQPIEVNDVARCIVLALDRDDLTRSGQRVSGRRFCDPSGCDHPAAKRRNLRFGQSTGRRQCGCRRQRGGQY